MSKPKVFIVDDDPTFVKLLEHELDLGKLLPYATFTSGEACLAELHYKPKLVLLDFSLGGLNGLDVLKIIKEKSPKTEVIMLTAIDDDAVKQKCLDEGASDYINKNPNGLDYMREKVIPKYKGGGIFSLFR
jgi:CheY-like chemotaxis protein